MGKNTEEAIQRRTLSEHEMQHFSDIAQMKREKRSLWTRNPLLWEEETLVEGCSDRLSSIVALTANRLMEAHTEGDQQATFILETLFIWSRLQNKVQGTFYTLEQFLAQPFDVLLMLLLLGEETQLHPNENILACLTPEANLRNDLLFPLSSREQMTLLYLCFGVLTYTEEPITKLDLVQSS